MKFLGGVIAAAALGLILAASAGAAPKTHEVLVVGNNWDGTADVVDPRTFKKLIRLNIVPDKDERIAEIMMDPAAAGFFTGVNLLIGEGHNQYVDDAYTSHDGRYLYVSRPSFKDVVGIDLSTRKIVWRFQVDGYRSDHMGISPDGRTLLVSASTGNVVHAINTATGKEAWRFDSGDSPHENTFSEDGTRIFHASIGRVYTPTDDPPVENASKGARYFQIVDARTHKILRRVKMGELLAKAGYPNMSDAVRPMAIAPGEKRIYLQVSFLHGFVEYDVPGNRVLRVARLPVSEETQKMRRQDYILDSAHHGIAINPEGKKLCVAGTMSNYLAIVSRATFAYRIAARGERPYWVTNSGDGKYCFISFSGNDAIAAISYAKEKEVARIPVGDHPQRMRIGRIRCDYLGPRVDCVAPTISGLRVRRSKRRRYRLRARLSEPARVKIVIQRRKGGRWRTKRVLRNRRARKGVNRFRLGKLRKKGRYRVRVRATDAAGNVSKRRVKRFRIKR
jgi:DNA-binding beta-propeller fold protein YncE